MPENHLVDIYLPPRHWRAIWADRQQPDGRIFTGRPVDPITRGSWILRFAQQHAEFALRLPVDEELSCFRANVYGTALELLRDRARREECPVALLLRELIAHHFDVGTCCICNSDL